MKSVYIKHILVILICFTFSGIAGAQENSNKKCSELLNSGFVSDGQEYIAKLDENNVAKFHTTFYGGSRYRIIGCSDIQDHPMVLNIFDVEKNLLFSNTDYNYTPYWDFTFTSTVDCIIEIKFESETHLKHEVKLLIGFKEK